MNNKRREKLSNAVKQIESGLSIVSDVLDEEVDCLANMPENLEGSDRYAQLEDNVDILESAYSDISDAKNSLEDLI